MCLIIKMIRGAVVLLSIACSVANGSTLDVGLVAHYRFDQDWKDSSGNQRDLTVSSANIKINGRYGWDPDSGTYRTTSTADFSTSSGARATYINGNTPSQNLVGFTFASWVKIDNFNRISPNEWSYLLGGDIYNGLQVRVSVAPDYNKNFWVLAWPHSNGFPAFNGVENATNIASGSWNHVAVTHDATTNLTEFFLNGQKKYEFINADPAHLDANYFFLGNSYHAQYNAGEMDDVRLYNRALTSLEVNYLAIPEPSAFSLLAIGLGVLAIVRRRRS
jgi:hypothetical protein